MEKLKFRQVHLDFHTSEKIQNIGECFCKEEFQEALITGHVDSVTVFSKCHHGWAYHPTKVHEMHGNLKFDLLKAQLEACKEIGVAAPVYISAGLDEKEAVRHPEWVSRLADESTTWVKDFTSEPGYHLLCFNTGYLELLLAQISEVMENYHPSGIFLDISSVHPCYCSCCRQEIISRGKDPSNYGDVMEQAEIVYGRYGRRVEQLIHSFDPQCRIFHNAGHITRGRRDIAGYNTHLELESLPTGGWGYDHFPMSASYAGGLGLEFLGMTGKFHTTWGEFGGFKHPNALIYETGLSLAFGAKCSIGDQLHPSGKMDLETYRLIGKAYEEVQKKEAWCKDAVNYADIAVLSDEAVNSRVSDRDIVRYADIGANRIMLEGKYLYRFIDLEASFDSYKVLILPDTIQIDGNLKKRLEAYMQNGGKILASGRSGLDSDGTQFVIDMGVKYQGMLTSKPSYVKTDFELITGCTPHVMYEQGYEIEVEQGDIKAVSLPSYFNRDIHHFCSHQHTPCSMEEGSPGVVTTRQTAYIGWEIFTDYGKKGSLHCKEIVCYLLDRLLGEDKTVRTEFPDRGVVTLTRQEQEDRLVLHFLFAHTTQRGKFIMQGSEKNIEVIEDLVPVYHVPVTLKQNKEVKRIYLAPSMEELNYHVDNGQLTFEIGKVKGHQMVVIE